MQTSFTEPPNSPLAICVCVHYKTPVPALGIFGLTLCQTIDAIDKCATCCHMALIFDIVHIFVYTVKNIKKFCCTFIHNLFYCFCPFCFCNFLKNGLTLSLPAVHAKYICLETSSAEARCSSEPAMRECCLTYFKLLWQPLLMPLTNVQCQSTPIYLYINLKTIEWCTKWVSLFWD